MLTRYAYLAPLHLHSRYHIPETQISDHARQLCRQFGESTVEICLDLD